MIKLLSIISLILTISSNLGVNKCKFCISQNHLDSIEKCDDEILYYATEPDENGIFNNELFEENNIV